MRTQPSVAGALLGLALVPLLLAWAAPPAAGQEPGGCEVVGGFEVCNLGPDGPSGAAVSGAFVRVKATLQHLYDVRGGTFGDVGDPAPCTPPSTDLVVDGEGRVYLMEVVSLVSGDQISQAFRCVGPGEPTDPPPPPTREEIFDSAPIPQPAIHVSPTVDGLVGLDTWLWGDEHGSVTVGLGPLRGWSVSGTVIAAEWIFETSDGGYCSADNPGRERFPVGSHIFSRHGTYTITHTVAWGGGFTVTGWGLSLTVDDLAADFTATVDYDVIEIEAVG
ncbi:MAG: hypothetical protein ACRD29_17395 [Acidimicrobiales bacterium]